MNDELSIRCGPADRSGRRLVLVTFGNAEFRDRFDTDDAYRRQRFRERAIEHLNLLDDAHESLEQRIVAEADAEDERQDCQSLTASEPVLVRMCDVEARAVDWLWPQRIALGRITLLVGVPGCGKSFLTVDMASRISTGSPWPDGSVCPRGSVILISAEDDPHDTIRPRLDAHQADVSNVHMLCTIRRTDDEGRESEMMFSLADVDVLEAALQRIDDCRLIVVDPIGSFLGGRTDSHRDNEVRAVLAPVAKLAEKYGPAVFVVAHRRKAKGTTADDLALGSRAFCGIARGVWHLSRDPDEKRRRLLLPGKSNIAPEQGGLAFTIAGEPASVSWDPEPVEMSADDAIAREYGNGAAQTTALDEAARWLQEMLDAGPVAAKELKDLARADGLSLRTLERGKAKLGVVACPDGFGGPWVWKLPELGDSFPTDRQESTQSAKESTLANSDDTAVDSVSCNGQATT